MVYLAEYHVREGIPVSRDQQRRVAPLELLDEADPAPDAPAPDAPAPEAAAPGPEAEAAGPPPGPDPAAAQEPAGPGPGPVGAAPAGLDPAVPAPAAPGGDKLDILTQLAHAQQDQATQIQDRLTQMAAELERIDLDGEARVRALDDRLAAMNGQVAKLTPPSPLEQLKSMAAISGGVSMEDYFNEWAQKNGDPTRVGPNAMYQAAEDDNEKGQTFYVDTTKVPDLNPDAVKRSLGLG
jgi:hypothetical protein